MLPFYAALPQGNLPQIRSSPAALHLDRAPSTWWKISESQLSMINHGQSYEIRLKIWFKHIKPPVFVEKISICWENTSLRVFLVKYIGLQLGFFTRPAGLENYENSSPYSFQCFQLWMEISLCYRMFRLSGGGHMRSHKKLNLGVEKI